MIRKIVYKFISKVDNILVIEICLFFFLFNIRKRKLNILEGCVVLKMDGKLKFLKFYIFFMLVYWYILRYYGLFYDENKFILFLKWLFRNFYINIYFFC